MELRKSGVDAQTARKQAYWDITPAPIANAPVAWVAPAITPIAPAPTTPIDNKQVLANNQAKVAWEIQAGTRPAVWQQSESLAPPTWTTTPSGATLNADWTVTNAPPVNATANPTTPAPTATPTTATASNTEAKVETKIETPKAEVTKTAEVPPPPITIGDMFNNIVNKIDVPPEQKALSTYKIAQNRYNKANMFATMTPAELSSQMKDAKIVEWSPAWEDLKMLNPWLVQSVKWLNIVNGVNPEIFTYVNNPDGTKVKQNNLVNSFVSDYEDNYGDIVKILRDIYSPQGQSARDAIYTPEVRAAEDKATSIELEMNRLSDTIDWIDKDIEKEYAWTGATGSRVALEKQYRREQLGNQYNSLLKNYTTYANKANNLITQNTDLYKTEQERQGKLQSALAGVALTQYQSQLGLQNKAQEMQMEADFAKKQAYENINDPATAINNVMEEYKKLGIPFTTTLQSRLQEFAQSGLSLPDYLTQMTESIQASPAYKQYAEKKAWELSDIQKIQLQAQISERADIRNFGQQIQLAQMQGDITRANYLWQIQNDPEKQAKLLELQQKANENKSLYDMLGVNVGTYEGNRGYDLAGKKWDPVPAGGNWKVKSIIDANYTSSPYGNSVAMEDENGNTVRYSHLESIGVKPWDTLGFGDIVGTRGNTGNVLGKNGEKLTAEQLKAWRGSHVDVEIKDTNGRLLSQSEQVNYLKGKRPAMQLDANAISIANWVWDLSDLTPTDKKTILPQLEQIVNSRMTGDQWRDAIVKSALYKKDVSDSTLQKITDMQTVAFQLDWIQERLANQKVWPILGQIKKLNPYDTEAQVALAELAGITPKVARGIFWEVWVLTDTDIANYQKTLPNLTSTEEKNAFVVDVMRKLLAKWVVNTIETQARWQRNMSPFLDVYDKAKSSMGTSTSKYE